MEKKDVLKNLKKIQSEIELINENKQNRAYISVSKHIDGVGSISDLENFRELVDAKIIIQSNFKSNDEENAMEDLGLTEVEINSLMKNTKKRYLGLTKSEWDCDLNTKLDELRESEKIAKFENAILILNKHLSDSDMFDIDTEGIDELISTIG
jgi:hypothetical protein